MARRPVHACRGKTPLSASGSRPYTKPALNGGYPSHRDAAKALNVGRDTAGTNFTELIEKGFIVQTRGHCLGPSGVGQLATYALTEERLDGAPASGDFMAWKNKIPAEKADIPWQDNAATPVEKSDIRRSKRRRIQPLLV